MKEIKPMPSNHEPRDCDIRDDLLPDQDCLGPPPLFPEVTDPVAHFQVLVEPQDAFENEAALEASIMGSKAARAYLGEYLGYELENFESQFKVLSNLQMRADIVASRVDSNEPAVAVELAMAMDTERVIRVHAYAKLLGARDAVLIAPSFPDGVKVLVDSMQDRDKDGITLHMIRVYAFKILGQQKHYFSFNPLTEVKVQCRPRTDLEDIIRKAGYSGDDSLNIDSIRVDRNGRVRIEAGSGLGTHTFIRISSHKTHARISVIIKDADLKKLIDEIWPGAHLNRLFSSYDGFEHEPARRNDTVVAGYNFRIIDPKARGKYHDTVASAYIELRSTLSHLLANVAGQVTTQRIIAFLPPTGAPQLMMPPTNRKGKPLKN